MADKGALISEINSLGSQIDTLKAEIDSEIDYLTSIDTLASENIKTEFTINGKTVQKLVIGNSEYLAYIPNCEPYPKEGLPLVLYFPETGAYSEYKQDPRLYTRNLAGLFDSNADVNLNAITLIPLGKEFAGKYDEKMTLNNAGAYQLMCEDIRTMVTTGVVDGNGNSLKVNKNSITICGHSRGARRVQEFMKFYSNTAPNTREYDANNQKTLREILNGEEGPEDDIVITNFVLGSTIKTSEFKFLDDPNYDRSMLEGKVVYLHGDCDANVEEYAKAAKFLNDNGLLYDDFYTADYSDNQKYDTEKYVLQGTKVDNIKMHQRKYISEKDKTLISANHIEVGASLWGTLVDLLSM